MTGSERITIRLTKKQLSMLNLLIEKGAYVSKNEALRSALSLLFERHGLKMIEQTDTASTRA